MKAGWEVRPLGEVCDFKGGSQPPKSQFIAEPRDGYIRMLQIRDFKSDDKAVYIPVTPKTNACEADDIMIGRYGASVGQIHRGKAGAYNVALIKTIPDLSQIDRDFLYHYLTSGLFQKPLVLVSKRGAQDGFSKPDISPFPVPIPPLKEQKRIVAVLDAAFKGLTRAAEHARANLQNARELFEASVELMFASASDNAKETGLGELIDFKNGFAFKSTDSVAESGVQLLRMGNLYQNQLDLGRRPKFYPDEFLVEFSRYELLPGDLVMSLTGTMGKKDYGFAVVIPQTDKRLLLNQRIAKIEVKDDRRLASSYLLILMRSRGFLQELYSIATGTRQANLSTVQMKKMKIKVPDISSQQKIAKLLELVKASELKLAENYQTKLTDIADLRQSLLQKAFAGELT